MSQVVCKDVGWDGQGFYCLRCGKAGFRSEAAARGHLSQCKGRAIQRGIPVVGSENLPAAPQGFELVAPGGRGHEPGGTYDQFSGGRGSLGGQNTTSLPLEPPGWYGGHETRITTLENEYNHLLMEKNQPQYHAVKQDFFSQYKGVIIVGAIILFAMMLSNQSKQCPGESGAKRVSMGDLGGKALSKLVDTGITKGVASLFK